jgi:hypothetical protein
MLAIASHANTPIPEAGTALEGARRVATRHGLIDHYGLRIAGIALAIAGRQTNESFGAMKVALAKAAHEYEQIRRATKS